MTISNDNQIRIWAMLAHLTSLLWIPVSYTGLLSLPVVNLLGPSIIWLLKRKAHPFINHHVKESLNFQISIGIYFVVLAIIIGISVSRSINTLAALVILLSMVLYICLLILVIRASVKAKQGDFYRYPITIRFLR
ncbi:MAG: DUF4870 domain-containing protein [Phormidium sp.]